LILVDLPFKNTSLGSSSSNWTPTSKVKTTGSLFTSQKKSKHHKNQVVLSSSKAWVHSWERDNIL